MPGRRLLALCLLFAAAIAGCGGSSSHPRAVPRRVNGVPRPAEPLSAALTRIAHTARTPTCPGVSEVVHSMYGPLGAAGCRSVVAELGGFEQARGKAYGTGAIANFTTAEGQHREMALAVDSDGRWKVLFVDEGAPSPLGTRSSPLFSLNVRAVLRALGSGDCDTFLRLASRSIGLAVGADAAVCRRVSDLTFRRELVENSAARPTPLGGNANLAFYALSTAPGRYYTLVMAQQRPGTGGAPSGAERFVLVAVAPAQ